MNSVPANLGETRSGAAVEFRRGTTEGFKAILAWWRLCRSRAASRHALARLSDWGLRDVGLTRAEAEGEAWKWSWRS
jgi:uncharacterized protein YjiS (DUF1127 family)